MPQKKLFQVLWDEFPGSVSTWVCMTAKNCPGGKKLVAGAYFSVAKADTYSQMRGSMCSDCSSMMVWSGKTTTTRF